MPEIYEVEVVANEVATSTSVPAAGLELEVVLDNVAKTGAVEDVTVVEVSLLGTVQVPDGPVVYNEGGVPGIMKLGTLDPVPPGTPAGTVILRTA
jgi:hypothetical protein